MREIEDKIKDLLIYNESDLNSILKKNLNLCIGRKWLNNDTIKYYVFTHRNPDSKYGITDLLKIIAKNNVIESDIYNLWIDTFR